MNAENMIQQEPSYSNFQMEIVEDNSIKIPTLHTFNLPPLLNDLYGGNLQFIKNPLTMNTPLVYVNFVMSKEGIYNINVKEKVGGATISHANHADAFGMALLRASADAVMVGSNTLKNEPHHKWHTDFIFDVFSQMKGFEPLRKEFHSFRNSLKKQCLYPPVFFMTNSGKDFNLEADVFSDPDIVTYITTCDQGASRVIQEHANLHAEKTGDIEINLYNTKNKLVTTIVQFGDTACDQKKMMEYLRKVKNIQYLLHEGGATVVNALAQDGLITQFFLTQMNLSPLCTSADLQKAQYLFGENHQIPPTAQTITKRTDIAGDAYLYNLDFRQVRGL